MGFITNIKNNEDKFLADLRNGGYPCKLIKKERSNEILNGIVSETEDNKVFITEIEGILYEIVFETNGSFELWLDHRPLKMNEITVGLWNNILEKIMFSNDLQGN